MRRLTALAVALFALPAAPAFASADVPVTFVGGTAEEWKQVTDVLFWPELPPLRQPITVTLGTGEASYAGCGGMVLSSAAELTVLHEYGHVWECQTMDGGWRSFIADVGGSGGLAWNGGSYDVRPAERFAQSFAAEVEYRRHGTRTPLYWVLYPPKLIERAIYSLTPCEWPRPYPWGCM